MNREEIKIYITILVVFDSKNAKQHSFSTDSR